MGPTTLFGDRLLNPTLKSYKDIILNKPYIFKNKYEYNINIFSKEGAYYEVKVKRFNSDYNSDEFWYITVSTNEINIWIQSGKLRELTDEEKNELL